jgi:hypothetical protein
MELAFLDILSVLLGGPVSIILYLLESLLGTALL